MNRFNLDSDDLGFVLIFTVLLGLYMMIEFFRLMIGTPHEDDCDEKVTCIDDNADDDADRHITN